MYRIRRVAISRPGIAVCMTGGFSGTRCGIVTEVDWGDAKYGIVNYCVNNDRGDTQGGDSGGPVYKGHNAYGLHLGMLRENRCLKVYQGIKEAQALLNVSILPRRR